MTLEKVIIKPNLSYVKNRNVPERTIKEIRKFERQLRTSLEKKELKIMTIPQLAFTMEIVAGIINSTPISRTSLVTPSCFMNPGAKATDLVLPELLSELPYVARLQAYIQVFKIIHYECMGGSTKLRTKDVGEKKIKPDIGSTVFFFKNEDNRNKGIIFGKIIKKIKSDYQIETSKGINVLIPYESIRIFVPEHSYLEPPGPTHS